jgi:uncharacterized membrane protein
MKELSDAHPRNRWSHVIRVIAGLVGVVVTAGSAFALVVMLAFWSESNPFPSAFAEFAATWGLLGVAIAVCAYWLWRSFRGFGANPADLVVLPFPLTATFFYLAVQGYLS